jgi:hypothetical protein
MSEKMMSQNKLTEIKLVPYNKPLKSFVHALDQPIAKRLPGGAAILSSCHASLAAPSFSHCAAPLSSRLLYLVRPPFLVALLPLSSCHASLATLSLSCCAAPLSSSRPSLIALPPLSLRHASLEPAGCHIATSLVVPLVTPWACPQG